MPAWVSVAVQSFLHSGRRSFFLGTAIALVTAIIVVLLSLGTGMRRQFVDAAAIVGSGHLSIAGFFKPSAESAIPVLLDPDPVRRVVLEALDGEVEEIVARHRGLVRIFSQDGTTRASYLVGVSIADEGRLRDYLTLADPAEYTDQAVTSGQISDLANPHTVAMFASQAKRLGVVVGDAVTARAELPDGRINTTDLSVVAVFEDVGMLGNWTFFSPNDSVRDLFQHKVASTGTLQVYLAEGAEVPDALAAVQTRLRGEGFEVMEYEPQPYFWKLDSLRAQDWTGSRLDLTMWDDEVSFVSWILDALDGLSVTIILFLFLMVAVGIINTMIVVVRERTTEIGTLRALGMTRGRVLASIMLESLLLGLVASVIGALLGGAVAGGLSKAEVSLPSAALRNILLNDVLTFAVRPWQLGTAIVLVATLTTLASIWPALRAARLRPITAMQKVD